MSVADAARKAKVSEQAVSNWKRQFIEAGRQGVAEGGKPGPNSRERALLAELAEVKAALGEAHVELRVWKRSAELPDRGPRDDPGRRRHERACQIAGVSNRRRWRAIGPNRIPAPAPDLLERDFTATAPNQRWVPGITEFDTGTGRLYLAAVLDLYARRIVGWAMDTTRTAELVVDALVMAIARRDPR